MADARTDDEEGAEPGGTTRASPVSPRGLRRRPGLAGPVVRRVRCGVREGSPPPDPASCAPGLAPAGLLQLLLDLREVERARRLARRVLLHGLEELRRERLDRD